jgi:Domain of unknown function (DUF4402)
MVKASLTVSTPVSLRLKGMSGQCFALLIPFALLSGALAMPSPIQAQCRLCDTPTTSVGDGVGQTPVAIEVQTRLDFDQLVVIDSSSRGIARLMPDGSSGVSGAIGAMSARAMVGSVVIRGEPGRPVRVDLPKSIQLYGLGGGSIRVESLTTDLPSQPRLDSQGSLQFRFGGELHVEGSVEGDFRGDVPITVDYL